MLTKDEWSFVSNQNCPRHVKRTEPIVAAGVTRRSGRLIPRPKQFGRRGAGLLEPGNTVATQTGTVALERSKSAHVEARQTGCHHREAPPPREISVLPSGLGR